MTDRERSKDRPHHVQSNSGSSTPNSGTPGSGEHKASGSGGGYFMGLFGGGSNRRTSVVPPTTSRAHATGGGSKKENAGSHGGGGAEAELDGLISPKSTSLALPGLTKSSSLRRAPSPNPPPRQTTPVTLVPFDLKSAVQAIGNAHREDDKNEGYLMETLNSTALYLASSLLERAASAAENIFDVPPHLDLEASEPSIQPLKTRVVDDADLVTLYQSVFRISNPSSSPGTRTSAIRLLAALIATYPPVYFTHNEQRTLKLPDEINVRSLYKLIISPITKTNMSTHIDAVFVQVGALKALTNSGKNVDGLDGVVGWLVRSLVDVQQEFAEWCKAKETDEQAWSKQADHHKYPDHIISANAADVAIAIIDLISSIVTTHIMLFTAQDVTRIVQPILDLISAGISSSSPTSAQQAEGPIGPTRRDSPVTLAFNSPSIVSAIGVGAGALGFEPALRQSMVISRSKADAGSLQGSSTPRNRKSHFSTSSESSPMIHQSPVPRASLSGHFDPRIPEAKWARLLPVLGSFLERLFAKAIISDGLFMNMLLFICVCFGQDESAFDIPEEAWTILCNILDTMLGPKGGRRAELLLHRILEGKMSASTSSQERSGTEGRNDEKVVVPNIPEVDRKLTRGAVIASRSLFPHLSSTSDESVASSTSLSSIVSSLRAAQSTSRFMGDAKAAQRKQWQPVDYEILALLQDHLFHLESDSKSNGDAWTEGYAACELLHGMIPLVLHDKLSSSHEIRPLEAIFDGIVHQVPGAVGRLHSSTSSSPTFLHPRYIELLLDLASRLDSEDAGVVIDYYQREYLCLPFTSGWIKNIWKLIESFYLPVSASVENKRKITTLLFRDVYRYAEDLPEHRITLVEKVLVPFLETTLMDEADDNFVKEALSVLVNAAVAETMERDEERRKRRLEKAEEGGGDLEDDLDTTSGSFDAIRKLIINLATQTQCKESSVSTLPSDAQTRSASAASAPSNDASASEKRNVHKVGKDSNNPFALRGLVDALSPPSKSKELPGVTTGLVSPRSDHDSPSIMSAAQSPMLPTDQSNHPSKSPNEPAHLQCRSLYAIKSLISIFTNLAFAPPHMLVSASSVIRTPASSNSIAIYRDLLGLLYPMTDTQKKQASSAPAVQIPARCPKARLAVLQFLFRLRADSKHRVYLRPNLDKAATAFAVTLKRTKDLEEEKRQESEELQRRSSARNAERNKPTDGAEERGRSSRMLESSTRSRSRSKQPASFVRTSAPEPPYNPLWRIPDELLFDVPEDVLPSEGLMTFDPNHPAWDTTESNAQAIFLPVSEYVRSLNGILRGHDWELVSYVLTFLPIQLSNKLFFHGMLATKEIKALLDALCSGVMGTNGPWDRRFNTPSFIKRADINAAAYQSLSILISYRGVFTRAECDRLVQSFIAGLQGKGELAKPCLQALSVAVFELEQSITRNLLEIVRSMISILTTTGLAVHILEFLIALGQNGSLFRNFTDEQYRLVFRVAIGYITEHNARTDQASVDLKDMVTREGYILSQHVIGLAYYAIYIWFMVLKLPQRPNLVSEITRELLKGRSQRVVVDEMAEVCFDWLARYTYGNADPKPSTSFLSEVVMNDNREGEKTEPKSLSWLLGGAIITVTSHPRSGWATITTTRPTGTTAIVCKLENVPLLDLGEANADLVSLPAVLMADRDPSRMRDDEAPEGEEPLPSARAIVDVKSSQPDPGTFDNTSQHGYIWSGATPSQRRKDVIVDPSYLALQLISSYPNASLDTPRGRLIPNEDKFSRALRGIQNTPVIDTLKIAVLYVAPGQTTETEILGNIDGSPLYLDFLSGLGRIIRLKGQVDVFVGGLNRDNDSDGEYAYAWWDDLTQTVFHIPTMMPNLPAYPNFENKKRLVGNDFVKIVYNDSGKEFNFDTIKTAWNFINVVISPYTNGLGEDELPRGISNQGWKLSEATTDTSAPGTQRRRGQDEEWLDWDREDWFKVTLQRADGIPDFSPIGTHKLVSRRALPIFVRQVAHLANDIAARFVHIRDAPDADSAEYITSWRSRLRAMHRLRTSLPPIELPDENDVASREQLLRDFTRSFSYRPAADKE